MWRRLENRARQVALQAFGDLERVVSWHLGGGKRFFHRYGPSLLDYHQWCFIVGCNNSGTSLLQNMLERSGKVSTLTLEGQRYTKVIPRDARRGYERVWTEYLSDLLMTDDDSHADVGRLAHDWMREYESPLNRVLVEKTTVNAVRMLWLQKAFPNSVFIGLVRNGFAVTAGIKRKGKKSVERGAKHWNLVNRLMLEDAEKVRNFHLLKYEDLVENSDASAARLENILALEAGALSASMQGEYELATVRGGGTQVVENLNRESAADLSTEELDTIEKEAAEMLARFGYERP